MKKLNFSKIILGGNVFGWTVDQNDSLKLLDYAFDQGITSIDTSDMYQTWVTGHQGGESEKIIGEWLKTQNNNREKIQIITKVGAPLGGNKKGLSFRYIKQAVEDSLTRLKTDYIDLYFSHYADSETDIQETLRAYEDLIKEGKVLKIGASNYSADELLASLEASQKFSLPQYEYFQPGYNLVNRENFEKNYQATCEKYNLSVMTYYSLAAGFLTGKYRALDQIENSPRKGMLLKYFNEKSFKILDVLDELSIKYQAQNSEIALAWIISKPFILAPIASATSNKQIDSLVLSTKLQLELSDLQFLDQASQW